MTSEPLSAGDLHSWAVAHLSDPELSEVARAVQHLVNDYLTQTVVIDLVRQLVETPAVSPQYWIMLDKISRYLAAMGA